MEPANVTRILHVTFTMEIGGTEQVIRQIAENSDAGCEHEIACLDGLIGSLGRALQAKGIRVTRLHRRPGFDRQLVGLLRRLIRERNISILHCHQYTPFFYGVLAALGTGARVIFTEHGRFYPERHRLRRRLVNPLLLLGCDHVTTISKATADALHRYEYVPRSRIQVIYNGIADLEPVAGTRDELLELLGLPGEFRYLGTVSRLEPIKNQAMMIRAFARLNHELPETRLILIGDGAARAGLETLAARLGLVERVIFTGFVDNASRFIRLFEVFLLSSFSEGTSMTLLEAMCLSRPAVVTDVGGNAEIVVHGETGLVTASDDEEAFAAAILQLLRDGELRLRLGRNGRNRYLERFEVARMTGAYQNLYRGIRRPDGV